MAGAAKADADNHIAYRVVRMIGSIVEKTGETLQISPGWNLNSLDLNNVFLKIFISELF